MIAWEAERIRFVVGSRLSCGSPWESCDSRLPVKLNPDVPPSPKLMIGTLIVTIGAAKRAEGSTLMLFEASRTSASLAKMTAPAPMVRVLVEPVCCVIGNAGAFDATTRAPGPLTAIDPRV